MMAAAAEKTETERSYLAAPVALRCEGMSDPLAVAEARPDLSWNLQAAAGGLHGVRLSAYQVRVAASKKDLPAGRRLLWNSGKTPSGVEAVPAAEYAGQPLEPQHEYWWQVRVWDEKGHASLWSRPAHWREAPVWRAQWIAAHATDAEAGREPMPLLRKTFSVPGQVKSAVLYIAGLGQYEVHVNGIKVGDSELTPGWSDYRKTVFYGSYDVTRLLRSGANAVGVLLGNGMYRVQSTPGRYTKFVGSYGPPQCIAQLHIEMTTGKSLNIESGTSWKTLPGPIVFSSTYGGEDYDARREAAGWDTAGFDDANWKQVVTTAGPGGALCPEAAPPVQVVRNYAPIRQREPRAGVTVYDMGQNFAGWPAITVSGTAGTTVKLIPGELLNPDGTVSQRSSGGPQWFSYTLKGGRTEQWHSRFSYYGFRYVQVEGAEEGKARVTELEGQAVHTSSAVIGSFASSDDLLNRIHAIIVRAVENNAQSLLTDCPHREKLGWLEETHLLAPSILYDFDFSGIYAGLARNIADAQCTAGAKAGMVPEIAPQYVVFDPQWDIFNDSPEWGSAAVLAPWYSYQRNGNLIALLRQREVMRRYVEYLGTRAHDGIVEYGLGDWYDIGPGDPGFSKLTTTGVTATAIYYQDLRVLEKVMALAGDTAGSLHYGRIAEAVRQAFNTRFFDAAQHRYDKGSQTAQAMPLALDMAPATEREHVLDALIANIRSHNDHVTAGDIGYHYVVAALLDAGRSDVLYDMLERTDAPSYGYQLAQGATALTEAWDANPQNSQDHFMLGDAEEWFYRGLGGIAVNLAAAPAQRLVLRPQVVGQLAWVRSRYDSVWGPIESEWHRGNTATEYTFTIPVNATATVKLKSCAPERMTVDEVPPDQAAGVLSSKITADGVELVLGSGQYRITALDCGKHRTQKD
jgi:hypothetical protein